MTDEFRTMLDLLRKSVFGREMRNNEIKNSYDVCVIAYHQSVLPLVYTALPQKIAKNECSEFGRICLMQLYNNEQHIYFLQKVIEIFEKNDIDYCVLKGCTAAQLYNRCECRISGVSSLKTSTGFCRIIAPASASSFTKWTVAPLYFTPYANAAS